MPEGMVISQLAKVLPLGCAKVCDAGVYGDADPGIGGVGGKFLVLLYET